MAVATMSVTVEGNPFLDGKADTARIICDWKSTDAGVVSKGICACYNTTPHYSSPQPAKIRGRITKIETSPGLLGAPATEPPTDQYDITLLDNYSYDVAAGGLANRSNTAAEAIVPTLPIDIDSEITVTIANAGNELHGRIIIWVDPMEV